jgi:hypothetical protein
VIDRHDADPDDLICDTSRTAPSGQSECTLRAAIEQANATGWPATIEFYVSRAFLSTSQAVR